MAKTLLQMQSDKQSLKSRFIAYKDVEPKLDMKLEEVKRLVLDIALTIAVHPIALGVKNEASGQISVPNGVRIDATIVFDIFAYIDSEGTQKGRKVLKIKPGLRTIPEPVLGLKLVFTEHKTRRLDAVLVMEHRNLSEVLLG